MPYLWLSKRKAGDRPAADQDEDRSVWAGSMVIDQCAQWSDSGHAEQARCISAFRQSGLAIPNNSLVARAYRLTLSAALCERSQEGPRLPPDAQALLPDRVRDRTATRSAGGS